MKEIKANTYGFEKNVINFHFDAMIYNGQRFSGRLKSS